ncbi:MAG: heme-copper oxidase subunit III [Candidatus Binataceae bacterium]
MANSAAEIGIVHAPHEVSTSFEIGKLGMWVFLSGETMVFGGLMGVFILMAISRGGWGPDGAHVNWRLGAINTFVLFTSSLTAALAQGAARVQDSARAKRYLSATTLLGVLFLVIKAFEYAGDYREGFTPLAALFWSFYYVMTGLHVLHLLGGIVVIFGLTLMMTPRTPSSWLERKLKYVCLYWYFVETVWVFLFALVYLAPSVG